MTYYRMCDIRNRKVTLVDQEPPYPFGAHDFTTVVFREIGVAQAIKFMDTVFLISAYLFILLPLVIVCLSIYGF